MTIGPRIYNRVAASGASPLNITTPQTTDAAHSNAQIIQTPRHVSWTVRDGNTPGDCNVSVRSPFSNDGDSKSIFSNVIGRELSDSPRVDIYLRCWVDLMSNTVRTEAPNFMDLGIPAVNASDGFNAFGTPTNRIIRPLDGPHWPAPDHVFG